MDLHDAIDRATNARSDVDKWINILNIIEFILCVFLAPFTFGMSLLGLLTIPAFAALGAIATHAKRTAELTFVQTQLLSDERR
jgi:hypothetical protein